MHIRYETGIATLVQFIVTAGLSFVSGLASVISGCTSGANADCVTNAFVSLVLIMLTVAALAVIAVLGYVAQARRSVRLAWLLMLIEAGTALIYLFDAKQSPALIERITNFIALLIALWVGIVAWQLSRLRGGRAVKPRARRRPTIA